MTATTTVALPRSTETTRAVPLWRTGARAGLVAATATTAVAAVAKAAGVPVEVGGEAIPLLGFAQLTLVCAAIGVVLAKALVRWAAKPQRTFVRATMALTALSFVPDLTADATTATRLALIATHVVAAAIVIPTVAARLPQAGR